MKRYENYYYACKLILTVIKGVYVKTPFISDDAKKLPTTGNKSGTEDIGFEILS